MLLTLWPQTCYPYLEILLISLWHSCAQDIAGTAIMTMPLCNDSLFCRTACINSSYTELPVESEFCATSDTSSYKIRPEADRFWSQSSCLGWWVYYALPCSALVAKTNGGQFVIQLHIIWLTAYNLGMLCCAGCTTDTRRNVWGRSPHRSVWQTYHAWQDAQQVESTRPPSFDLLTGSLFKIFGENP